MESTKRKENDVVILAIDRYEVKLESVKEFESSYYSNVYRNAYKLVNEIIIENQSIVKENEYMMKSDIRNQVCNTISFIGGRGSGKSSAMCSFMKSLKEYNSNSEKEFYTNDFCFKEKERNINIGFVCLESIDASLLEKGEDIFGLILAKMFSKLLDLEKYESQQYQGRNYEYQKRQLQGQFENIYKGLRELNSEKKECGEYWGDSSILYLKSMSNSLDLRMNFQKLVHSYLSLVYQSTSEHIFNSGNGKETYLVVTIDDLDLNIESGFDMLEQIHRYLMIPNVIVLIAAEYDQLLHLCEKHFYDMFPKTKQKGKDYLENHIMVLAKDYLEKVLPINNRIYMPSIRTSTSLVLTKKEKADIKHALLGKIFRRMGVYCDGMGIKKHFYEPNSIRQLKNFYLFLEDMEKISWRELKQNYLLYTSSLKEDEQKDKLKRMLKKYDRNYERFLSDINFRMANEILLPDQRYQYKTICMVDISRRTPLFLNQAIQSMIEKKHESVIENAEWRVETFSNQYVFFGYSYGELLHALYLWGRVVPEEKPMVHCILASYSAILTKQYIHWLYDYEESMQIRAINKLEDVIGGSIVGSWGNYLLPVLKSGDDSSGYEYSRIGMLKQVDMNLGFQLDIELPMELNVKNLESWVRYIKDSSLIKHIEILSMFFVKAKSTSYADCSFTPAFSVETETRNEDLQNEAFAVEEAQMDDGEWKKIDVGRLPTAEANKNIIEQEIKPKELRLRSSSIHVYAKDVKFADFDVMGFVVWSLKIKENIERIENSIFESIFSNLDDASKQREQEGKILKTSIQNASILNNRNEKSLLPLPIYNLDLTYNIIKRTRKHCSNGMPGEVESKDVLKYLIEQYENIKGQLEDQEKYYNESSETDEQSTLVQDFIENPFVKFMLNADNDTVFAEMFENMLRVIINCNANEHKE